MLYMIDKMKTSKKGIEKLVFMGDYVDRGMYGPEVVAYLCAMKLERPKDIFMLRGKHLSCPSKPCSNLVTYHQHLIFIAEISYLLQKSRRRCDYSGSSLH